jgi:hypothetical protein
MSVDRMTLIRMILIRFPFGIMILNGKVLSTMRHCRLTLFRMTPVKMTLGMVKFNRMTII